MKRPDQHPGRQADPGDNSAHGEPLHSAVIHPVTPPVWRAAGAVDWPGAGRVCA